MRKTSVAALAALLLGATSLPSLAGQPHMEAALAALNTAKTELAAADSDKGGYRAKAMKGVDEAIKQVKAGVEFDQKNATETPATGEAPK